MADTPETGADFKPNLYPIMYWALAYGAIAGVSLYIAYLLSQFITIIWFPVFLVGLVWGGYRNYKRQKMQWSQSSGTPLPPAGTPIEEFRKAVGDIINVSQEMIAQQPEQGSQEEVPVDESEVVSEDVGEEVQAEEVAEVNEASQEVIQEPAPEIIPIPASEESAAPIIPPTPQNPPSNLPNNNQFPPIT